MTSASAIRPFWTSHRGLSGIHLVNIYCECMTGWLSEWASEQMTLVSVYVWQMNKVAEMNDKMSEQACLMSKSCKLLNRHRQIAFFCSAGDQWQLDIEHHMCYKWTKHKIAVTIDYSALVLVMGLPKFYAKPLIYVHGDLHIKIFPLTTRCQAAELPLVSRPWWGGATPAAHTPSTLAS